LYNRKVAVVLKRLTTDGLALQCKSIKT